MDPKALEDMRLDVRLLHRSGWLEDQEREAALASLPDVSHKLERADPAEVAASGASPEPPERANAGLPPSEPPLGGDGGLT